MRHKIKLSNDTFIEIDKKPFASGGEADIYKILSPVNYSKQVLKIYKIEKRTKEKNEKIKFLIGNRPNLRITNNHHSVIWPIHQAYINDNFVGYTMPEASGIKLEFLCHPKLPKDLPIEWRKFSFNSAGSIEVRLRLCFNIAAALYQIHSFGSYVLVDMKPDNVIVKPNGFISIIDIDSVEIIKNENLLFPAQVATPEYTPPEFYKTIKNIEKNVISETWDRFSLAIIFYRLLFGIHPFTASLKAPYEGLTNISEIIQNGFLPVGKSKDKFAVIPSPHNNFRNLNAQVRQFFLKALEESINSPNIRPSADDWCRILAPPPVVEINRHMPTKSFPCFVPVFSEAVKLKPIPDIRLEKPIYITASANDKFLIKFIRLFKESEKEKIMESILSIQKRVDEEFYCLENILSQCFNERKKSKVAIARILRTERVSIEEVQKSYLLKAKAIDNKAKELFRREEEKLTLFENDFINKSNDIELKIKEDYELTLNSFEANYAQEKRKLHSDVATLNNDETHKMKTLDKEFQKTMNIVRTKVQKFEKEYNGKEDLKAKLLLQDIEKRRNAIKLEEEKLLKDALEKYQASFTNKYLSQFSILDERFTIFNDVYADPDIIIENLRSSGIYTAADIKGVNESGQILNPNGTWIKVAEIGINRAKKLEEWRRRKERTNFSIPPPQILPHDMEMNLKRTILVKLKSLDEEVKAVKRQVKENKSKITQQLVALSLHAKEDEAKITKEFHLEKYNVSSHNKIKRNELLKKITELNENYRMMRKRPQLIFEQKVKVLRKKLEELKMSKERYYAETTKEFDIYHVKLINELKDLDRQFADEVNCIRELTADRMKNRRAVFDSELALITKKIRETTDSYNMFVNQLFEFQNKYSQMR